NQRVALPEIGADERLRARDIVEREHAAAVGLEACDHLADLPGLPRETMLGTQSHLGDLGAWRRRGVSGKVQPFNPKRVGAAENRADIMERSDVMGDEHHAKIRSGTVSELAENGEGIIVE